MDVSGDGACMSVLKRIIWRHYVLPAELVERMRKIVAKGYNPSSRYRSLRDFVIKTIEKRVEELERLEERKKS